MDSTHRASPNLSRWGAIAFAALWVIWHFKSVPSSIYAGAPIPFFNVNK